MTLTPFGECPVVGNKFVCTCPNRCDVAAFREEIAAPPLLNTTGIDSWQLLQEQAKVSGSGDRVFPYNGRSVGTAFRRACRELGIDDLRFHDLRHEAASRLAPSIAI